MTGRPTAFSHPHLLGFDYLERMLERAAKAAGDGYPPFNIEQVDDQRLRITFAVAGFGQDDLSVMIEGDQLVIRGRTQDDRQKIYLHRGIAARQFQKAFVLAEGIEVVAASLEHGLLHVDLLRTAPEPKVRTVEIKAGGGRQDLGVG